MTVFTNDKCSRVTEAATGRTRNFYMYLLRKGTLPVDMSLPKHPTNEEKRNWYVVQEEEVLAKSNSANLDVVGGDVEVDGEEKGKTGKWLVVDVLVRHNKPQGYSRTDKWGEGVAAGVGLRIGKSLLSGLPGDKSRGVFATSKIKNEKVVCGSVGMYMLETKKQHSKSDRVVKLSRTVREQELAVYFNICKHCPSACINDGVKGSKSGSVSKVNVKFVENVERDFNSTHYLTVVATRDIEEGDELYLDYGTNYWYGNLKRRKKHKGKGVGKGKKKKVVVADERSSSSGSSSSSNSSSSSGSSSSSSSSGSEDNNIEEIDLRPERKEVSSKQSDQVEVDKVAEAGGSGGGETVENSVKAGRTRSSKRVHEVAVDEAMEAVEEKEVSQKPAKVRRTRQTTLHTATTDKTK